MLGAIAGDIIGSVYEAYPIKTTRFPLFSTASRFTDDTVLTVAVAYAILNKLEYQDAIRSFARRYPDAGYGGRFFDWLFSDHPEPYFSWGNGSAMRVSAVGFAYDSMETVLDEAQRSAAITHDHPEGIKGAQATALATFLARKENSKQTIKQAIVEYFGYDLDRSLEQIRPTYRFDISCQGSVPEAMIAFLEAYDFESAIRNAISLGGDSDTLACIAGGISQAYYKTLPQTIQDPVRARLPVEFVSVIDEFNHRFGIDP